MAIGGSLQMNGGSPNRKSSNHESSDHFYISAVATLVFVIFHSLYHEERCNTIRPHLLRTNEGSAKVGAS